MIVHVPALIRSAVPSATRAVAERDLPTPTETTPTVPFASGRPTGSRATQRSVPRSATSPVSWIRHVSVADTAPESRAMSVTRAVTSTAWFGLKKTRSASHISG